MDLSLDVNAALASRNYLKVEWAAGLQRRQPSAKVEAMSNIAELDEASANSSDSVDHIRLTMLHCDRLTATVASWQRICGPSRPARAGMWRRVAHETCQLNASLVPDECRLCRIVPDCRDLRYVRACAGDFM